MKIVVCIGSSCHIKGSRKVVEQLKNLIAEHNLGDKIEMGGCQEGVCVTVDDKFYSVTPETTEQFFHEAVLGKVN